jgi:hypothetical protein
MREADQVPELVRIWADANLISSRAQLRLAAGTSLLEGGGTAAPREKD